MKILTWSASDDKEKLTSKHSKCRLGECREKSSGDACTGRQQRIGKAVNRATEVVSKEAATAE